MKDFKEIAEKCLAGELSGRFVCRDGLQISSFTLSRTDNPLYPYKLYRVGELNNDGLTPNRYSQNDIIQFIPYKEMKKEQITIDIPENKVPVIEQTEKGVVITWKEHELTYTELLNEFRNNLECIHVNLINSSSQAFHKKVEVLRKLTNIRNYFGKPDMLEGWCIFYQKAANKFYVDKEYRAYPLKVIFAKKEHAEQAIKMLGDELKYLFKPW